MHPFAYVRPVETADAVARAATDGRYLAGGTNLVDMMRLGIEHPAALVDVQSLPLVGIEAHEGGLRIGARVSNAALAADASVRERYAALSEALLAGASPQIRNMATTAGNLLQRTRCAYFRDPSIPCNKKTPGAGCPAMDGINRAHAVLGGSDACIATHPSDMAVALVMFGATVEVEGPNGSRTIALADLHTLPGDHPEIETSLARDELITHVNLPDASALGRSTYVKVRDRAAFAFALASAAVALRVESGKVASARVALGGVATKPWRSEAAEAELVGSAPTRGAFERAGRAAMAGAAPRTHNAFKVELGARVVVRALERAAEAA
ncbi:MAG: xanthine dehydrogenase family protein subunit M [Polyangiaceae bacterium]